MNNSNITLFADDTTLTISNRNRNILETETHIALLLLQKWCSENELVINAKKTNFILFHTIKHNEPDTLSVKINNEKIEGTNSTTFLGIKIDKNLNFKEHTEALLKKLSSIIFAIKVIKNKVGLTTAKTAYHALFEPHIRYGITVWGNITNINKVFIIQKRLIKYLMSKGPRSHCKNLFKKLEILTVPSILILECLLYIKKNEASATKNNEIHDHNTRNKDNIHFNHHRLTKYQKSPHHLSVKLYNRLPTQLKKESNVLLFKNQIKKILKEQAFYTAEEFLNHDFA